MNERRRVLLVDGIPETEQVLRAVYEPRGLEVERIRSRQQAVPTGPDLSANVDGAATPDVIVLESQAADTAQWTGPRVIIGGCGGTQESAAGPRQRILEQPFHYGELIRAVDDLLNPPEIN